MCTTPVDIEVKTPAPTTCVLNKADDIAIEVETALASDKVEVEDNAVEVNISTASDMTDDTTLDTNIIEQAIATSYGIDMDVKTSRATDTDDLPNDMKPVKLNELPRRINYTDSGTEMDGFVIQPERLDKATCCNIVMKDASTSMEYDKVMIDVAVGTVEDSAEIGSDVLAVVDTGMDISEAVVVAANDSAQLNFEFNDSLDLDGEFVKY